MMVSTLLETKFYLLPTGLLLSFSNYYSPVIFSSDSNSCPLIFMSTDTDTVAIILFPIDCCAMMALRCLALLLAPLKTKKLCENIPFILKVVPVSLRENCTLIL